MPPPASVTFGFDTAERSDTRQHNIRALAQCVKWMKYISTRSLFCFSFNFAKNSQDSTCGTKPKKKKKITQKLHAYKFYFTFSFYGAEETDWNRVKLNSIVFAEWSNSVERPPIRSRSKRRLWDRGEKELDRRGAYRRCLHRADVYVCAQTVRLYDSVENRDELRSE